MITSILNRVIKISAKTGDGVENLLNNIIENLPNPRNLELTNSNLFNNEEKSFIENKFYKKKLKNINELIFRGLVFDSWFIENKGVFFFLRIFNGNLKINDSFVFHSELNNYIVSYIGKFVPNEKEFTELKEGEVGFIYCNIKKSKDANKFLGYSVTSINSNISQLNSIEKPKPILFCSLFPENTEELDKFKLAIEKLNLEDPSIEIESDNSAGLGQGFKIGFLGSLHMEIFIDRLKKDFKIFCISTPPNIKFKALIDKDYITVKNPSEVKDIVAKSWKEQICQVYIMIDSSFDPDIRGLVESSRGSITEVVNFLSQNKYICEIPLIEIIDNFNEKIKTISHGFASWDYELHSYKKSNIQVVEIYINNEFIESFSFICHKSKSFNKAKNLCKIIKENLPNQLFTFSIQGKINNRIIASETMKSVGKNVTAKCYGGDVSRKRKLLDRQKEGKKNLKELGKVNVSSDSITNIFKEMQNN